VINAARAGLLFGQPRGLLVAADGTSVHILGHAAGVAAALAVRNDRSVQDVDVAALQARLLEEGAVFSLGQEYQDRGLAAIRKRYAEAAATGTGCLGRALPLVEL